MTETKLSTGTVRLSRVIKAPAERIYNVFLDPDAFAKWIPPGGYTGKVHAMEPKVGGTYRMSFTSLDKKDHSTFGGKYLELVPFTKIRYTDVFETDNPEMIGEMVTTITLRKVSGGTEVKIEHTGIPKLIPAEMAKMGWQSSLQNLAALVEMPDIAGAPR